MHSDRRVVLEVKDVSKLYRLGNIGTGTLSHDLNRWWHKVRGKADPYAKVGTINDRTEIGDSRYVWALQDINFKVYEGDVLGVVGRNGAGKSTLLKVLSRITSPTTGTLGYNGRLAALLEVGTGFHPELTGRENIYLNGAIMGMSRKAVSARLDEIVDFSGCAKYIDTPVKRYSSGMIVRLGFSVAAHLDTDILVVDEVLAVGDADFQSKCIGKMNDVSKSGKTVLFVSHNLAMIRQLCNRCIYLENGRLHSEGDTDLILGHYLTKNSDTARTFEHGPIRKVEVIPETESIRLKCHYKVDRIVHIPNLGFVVNNQFGSSVFGNNTLNSGMSANREFPAEGVIEVEIKSPKLVVGKYTVSIWFGDGQEDFFHEPDCVEFELIQKSTSQFAGSAKVGSVLTDCEFKISAL
ncbi:MAG: ABC transporter ATP-binding protein [Flavobacteriales bacterium]|nr:MAG: ABC transporter ATP-binding protein [Flavobacteriales bacterium]